MNKKDTYDRDGCILLWETFLMYLLIEYQKGRIPQEEVEKIIWFLRKDSVYL